MGEYGLVGRAVAELFVAGEDIVYECGAGTPVAEDEDGVLRHGLACQAGGIAALLQRGKGGEQAAHGLREMVFLLPRAIYFAVLRDLAEGFPVGTYQGIYR